MLHLQKFKELNIQIFVCGGSRSSIFVAQGASVERLGHCSSIMAMRSTHSPYVQTYDEYAPYIRST